MVEERDRATAELSKARKRAVDVEAQLKRRPTGYDAARHEAVRAQLTKLEPIALEAAALERQSQRAEGLIQEAEQAERAMSKAEQRAKSLADAIKAEGYSEAQFAAAKTRHDRAQLALREAEIVAVEVRGDLTRAENDF